MTKWEDCSDSIVNALELGQSCTKPSKNTQISVHELRFLIHVNHSKWNQILDNNNKKSRNQPTQILWTNIKEKARAKMLLPGFPEGCLKEANPVNFLVVTFSSILWRSGPFLQTLFNFNPACLSNHIHFKMWYEITYHPFSWELRSNFMSHFTGHVITYPCED